MKQAEQIYLISDAAKQVQVETHVLRYWEEELKLPIKRNEMGHRFYTQEDIERFREIRDLKEKGLQLKAIRSLLTRGNISIPLPEASSELLGDNRGEEKKARQTEDTEPAKRHLVMVNKGEFTPVSEESREAKSLRLQQLLQHMIAEAVQSSNKEVCNEIKESLVKELDYQFRLQEEKEDEREAERIDRQEAHYRQIDELIRSRNKRRGGRWEAEEAAQSYPAEGEAAEAEKEKGERPGKKRGGFLRKKRSIS